jgi:tetratricopeptide (TPR) repeat protein
MQGYSAREVATLLGLSVAQVRAYVGTGFLSPARGARGELRFSFQDLVLLRTAKGLMSARVSPMRVKRALKRLKAQLPEGRPLSGVQISAEGNRIVVSDGDSRWHPESGQALFDFEVADIERRVAKLAPSELRPTNHRGDDDDDGDADAQSLYERASELEIEAPEAALKVYERVLALDSGHVDAHINVGRLYHERGALAQALTHYRRALVLRPEDATAAFNLAVALEDQGDEPSAIDAYRHVLAIEPTYADAHYNLARLYESRGRHPDAIRHLRTYRDLLRK